MTIARTRAGLGRVGLVGALLVLLVVLGRLLAVAPEMALAAAGLVLAVGVAAVDMAAIPVLATPVLLVTLRVGGESLNLTLADAILALAFVPAVLVAIAGVSRPMRQAIWLGVVYQVATLLTVIANPYRANVIEWFHAGLLVIGAMVVGWAVGRRGYARWGLSFILVVGIGLALSNLGQAALQYARGDFSPVYMAWPYGAHKNSIGTILAVLAIIAYARPPWMGWTRKWSLLAFWTLVAGLATTQSRQAIIGLGVAILVAVMRHTTTRRRSKGILLAIIPALVAVSVMVQDQIESGNQFNSVFQRVNWFQEARDVWLTDPWFGVGLRWWNTDRFSVAFQPPNGEIEVLTSSGVVGLAAFLALIIGTWIIARRIDPVYGFVVELVLVLRFVQSQLDLFWVSVQASLPFLVLGICLGALAHRDENRNTAEATREQIGRALHPSGLSPTSGPEDTTA